jgi:hypothetical protein
MGKGWEGIAASNGSDGFDSRERSYDVGLSPPKDRSGAKSAVGEDTGGNQEGGVKYGARIKPRCFGGGHFSLMRNYCGLDAR